MGRIEMFLHVCGLLFLWTQSRNHASMPCNPPSWGGGASQIHGEAVYR